MYKKIFGNNEIFMLEKSLVKMIGIDASILLAYLSDKWLDVMTNWVEINHKEIELETTLSLHKQKKALDVLVQIDLIEYRIDQRQIVFKQYYLSREYTRTPRIRHYKNSKLQSEGA